MNVQIIKNEKGDAIGWSMEGDSPEEIDKLGIIRDLQFFGFDETAIRYAGREGGNYAERNPGILSWKQKKTTNK